MVLPLTLTVGLVPVVRVQGGERVKRVGGRGLVCELHR